MIQLAVQKSMAIKLLFVSAGIAAVDQLVKRLIRDLPLGVTIAKLPPFFEIVRTQNKGAAFSILSGKTFVLLALTTIMLAALLLAILFYKRFSNHARWAASMLLGGGIGNWLDRFSYGMVSDYIRLPFIDFPVFNLADIFITLSVGYLITLLLIGRFESDEGETHESSH